MMEDPAKGFSERVRKVNDPRDVLHDDVPTLFPTLYGEHLNVDMWAALFTLLSLMTPNRLKVISQKICLFCGMSGCTEW